MLREARLQNGQSGMSTTRSKPGIMTRIFPPRGKSIPGPIRESGSLPERQRHRPIAHLRLELRPVDQAQMSVQVLDE
jgi:hypothetical protein